MSNARKYANMDDKFPKCPFRTIIAISAPLYQHPLTSLNKLCVCVVCRILLTEVHLPMYWQTAMHGQGWGREWCPLGYNIQVSAPSASSQSFLPSLPAEQPEEDYTASHWCFTMDKATILPVLTCGIQEELPTQWCDVCVSAVTKSLCLSHEPQTNTLACHVATLSDWWVKGNWDLSVI